MALPDIECKDCGEAFSFAYPDEIKKHMEEIGHNMFNWQIYGKWYRMILTGMTERNFPSDSNLVEDEKS